MSKENVALFIKHSNKHSDLQNQMEQSNKTTEWVDIGRQAGFDFTAREFADVISEALGKKMTEGDAVPGVFDGAAYDDES
jgi:predicted ribosomally synthesized peptide with nif11-like leader